MESRPTRSRRLLRLYVTLPVSLSVKTWWLFSPFQFHFISYENEKPPNTLVINIIEYAEEVDSGDGDFQGSMGFYY